MGSSPFCPDAPMPLDGPLVPHNLMPSHGKSVPLLKFQMAFRLTLNFLWVQEEGTQIYT